MLPTPACPHLFLPPANWPYLSSIISAHSCLSSSTPDQLCPPLRVPACPCLCLPLPNTTAPDQPQTLSLVLGSERKAPPGASRVLPSCEAPCVLWAFPTGPGRTQRDTSPSSSSASIGHRGRGALVLLTLRQLSLKEGQRAAEGPCREQSPQPSCYELLSLQSSSMVWSGMMSSFSSSQHSGHPTSSTSPSASLDTPRHPSNPSRSPWPLSGRGHGLVSAPRNTRWVIARSLNAAAISVRMCSQPSSRGSGLPWSRFPGLSTCWRGGQDGGPACACRSERFSVQVTYLPNLMVPS